MSSFRAKAKNQFGEYEITFCTTDPDEYRRVQEVCREMLDRHVRKSDTDAAYECGYYAGYKDGHDIGFQWGRKIENAFNKK